MYSAKLSVKGRDDPQRAVVESAMEALSHDEPDLVRARRIATMISDVSLRVEDRIALLGRLLRIEPRIARATGLRLAADAPDALRQAIGGVLSVTQGSEDDLPVLLSLAANEPMAEIRRNFQAAIETLNTVNIGDSLAVLSKLLNRPLTAHRLDAALLLPQAENHYMFCRWVNKAWCRAVDRDVARYAVAVLSLVEIMIDQLVVAAGFTVVGDSLSAGEIDAIRYQLAGRPSHMRLATTRDLIVRWPWLERYRELCERYGHLRSPGTKPLRQAMGTLDAERITEALAFIGEEWIAAMYALAETR